MKLSNCIKYIFFIIFICLFSLNTNAYPKKKHAIIKDKIDKRDYEYVFQLGYVYGYLEYCNFARTEHKEIYKRGMCPVAEDLQKKIMQFKTNYRSLTEARNKARLLNELIINLET